MTTRNFVVKNGITTGNIVLDAASGNITGVGNANLGNLVVANFFSGSGNLLSNIQAANISGTTANANYSTYAGTVTTAAQPNITSVGTLTTVSVSGNANIGNIGTAGLITATGNVSAGNLVTGGVVSATGNGTFGNVTATLFSGNLSGTGNSNIGNIGTSGLITATGNITGGNLVTGGVLSVTGNANIGNIGTATLTATGVASIGGNLNMNSKNIVSLAEPQNAQDAATKNYVDSVASGLDPKASVNVATTAGLAAYTYNNGTSGVGATITANANGALTIDGVAVATNNRVLVKNETNSNTPYNGIYVVTNTGSAGAPFVLTRSTDFDTGSEIPSAFTFVEDGSTQADTGWVCTTSSPVTVGTTNINWAQFSGAGSYTAGTGLTLTGTTFSINTAQPTVTSVGTLTALSVSGNANVGNVGTSSLTVTGTTSLGAVGNVSITGGSNGQYLQTNGSGSLSWQTISTSSITNGNSNVTVVANANVNISSTGNANVVVVTGTGANVSGTLSASGNITGANLVTGGVISATGNANVGNIGATGGVFTTVAGSLTTASQPNVTSLGTLTSVSVSGNANVGNLNTAGVVSATGNITGGNVSGTLLTGTLATAAQPNVTSLGTLTSVTVSGNANVGNLGTSGLVTVTGNITGGNIVTGGVVSATGNVTGGNVSTTGNVTAGTLVSSGITTSRANVSVTTNSVIDQFAPATYRTAKYVISASGDNGYQSVETLLVQDGTSAYITIYGSVCSNVSADIIDITANINGVSGNVTLYATSASANCKVNVVAGYIKT